MTLFSGTWASLLLGILDLHILFRFSSNKGKHVIVPFQALLQAHFIILWTVLRDRFTGKLFDTTGFRNVSVPFCFPPHSQYRSLLVEAVKMRPRMTEFVVVVVVVFVGRYVLHSSISLAYTLLVCMWYTLVFISCPGKLGIHFPSLSW